MEDGERKGIYVPLLINIIVSFITIIIIACQCLLIYALLY